MSGGGLSAEIFIVDDDPSVRDGLAVLFSREGFQVTSFPDGASFLAFARNRPPTCTLLDVHIPGPSGLDILKQLTAAKYPAPVFLMSGRGDIPMAVEAMKNGAQDFIEKPFRGVSVVSRVRAALDAHKQRAHQNGNGFDGAVCELPGPDLLTPREHEVLRHIASGASNKEIGRRLGLSPRTIEVHRLRINKKLGAKNAADLIRIVFSKARNLVSV